MTALSLLIDLAAKATAMLLIAWILSLLLRHSSAALRALLWSATLGALLALPVLMWVLPAWRTTLIPTLGWRSTPVPAVAPAVAPRVTSSVPDATLPVLPTVPAPAAEGAPAPPGRQGVTPDESPPSIPWVALLPAIWAVGFLLVLGWYAGGQLQAWRMARRARPAPSPRWDALVETLRARLAMRRDVSVRHTDETTVPLTWGMRRDVIFIPTLADSWTASEREAVLLHELAHVDRRDCLLQLGTHFACAIYWFHPGVWYAASRLRTERERACDDAVLSAGGHPHDYAAHLVRLARDARRLPVGAIAMARRSQLEGRLLSILDAGVDRRRVTRRATRRLAVLALAVSAPLAALRPLGAAPTAAPPLDESLPLIERRVGTQTRTLDAPGPSAGAPKRNETTDAALVATAFAAESVIVAPAAGAPLAERWAWALREGARLGSEVWIGYGLSTDDARRQGMISDSEGSSLDERLTRGPSLSRLIRDASANAQSGEVAIVFLVRPGAGEIRRVRVWTTSLNMHLHGHPLLWLGAVRDEESVPHLRTLFDRASTERLQETLVTGIAAHETESLVLPFLQEIVSGNRSTEVRERATEGLGFHDGADSMRLLMQLARGDGAPRVRREAAETLGMLRRSDAADSLAALVGSATDVKVRAEAAEAFGDVDDPRVEAMLEKIAFSDDHEDVLREAAETLGDLDGSRGLSQLERIARTHPRAGVRAEALESLAGKPEREVLPILRRAAFEDASERVQAEAIETLGDIESASAREILREIVARHPSSRMRREAEETLGG